MTLVGLCIKTVAVKQLTLKQVLAFSAPENILKAIQAKCITMQLLT